MNEFRLVTKHETLYVHAANEVTYLYKLSNEILWTEIVHLLLYET
jgi:hypothetical protein